MAPNTAVLKPYLGSDSLRQNVQGEIKHMINRQKKSTPYCGWLKSCTTWDVWNPIDNGKNYLSTGAGFQPSTVWPIKNVISGKSHNGQTKIGPTGLQVYIYTYIFFSYSSPWAFPQRSHTKDSSNPKGMLVLCFFFQWAWLKYIQINMESKSLLISINFTPNKHPQLPIFSR